MRDDDVRSACFAALDVLQAKWGADVPYAGLREGFNFRGRKVPFLNRAYGIYRAAGVQRGPAALSVNSSYKQDRYLDEQTPDGVLYRYQGDDPDNHFNRWLRSAHLLDVPLVYFSVRWWNSLHQVQSTPQTVSPVFHWPLRINAFGVLFLMIGLVATRSRVAQMRLRSELAPPLPVPSPAGTFAAEEAEA